MYHSFVMSTFTEFYYQTNTKKIMKIQERAVRFIYAFKTSFYEDLSRLPTPRIKRKKYSTLYTRLSHHLIKDALIINYIK